MAIYTVELRRILQQEWLNNNPTSTVEDVQKLKPLELCKAVWNDIFYFDFPVWSTITKEELCVQILMNYFMREIGLETVELWKQCLWIKMTGIMPYYTNLAEAQISMGKIFETQNITETVNRSGSEDNTTKENGELTQTQNRNRDLTSGMEHQNSTTQNGTSTQDTVTNNTVDGKNFFSDTPQNGLQDVISGTYMTNATVDSNEETGSTKVDFTGSQTNIQTQSGNQKQKEDDVTTMDNTTGKTGKYDKDYSENVSRETFGFNGNKVQLLKQYQDTLKHIPLLIIQSMSDLFMGIL